jgi:hypothetical protein
MFAGPLCWSSPGTTPEEAVHLRRDTTPGGIAGLRHAAATWRGTAGPGASGDNARPGRPVATDGIAAARATPRRARPSPEADPGGLRPLPRAVRRSVAQWPRKFIPGQPGTGWPVGGRPCVAAAAPTQQRPPSACRQRGCRQAEWALMQSAGPSVAPEPVVSRDSPGRCRATCGESACPLVVCRRRRRRPRRLVPASRCGTLSDSRNVVLSLPLAAADSRRGQALESAVPSCSPWR